MNYYDERKEKIINESKQIKICEENSYSHKKNNFKKNKFKKIYTSAMYIVFFGSLSFILYNYANKEHVKNINHKIVDIKKIKNPDEFTPLTKPLKKGVDTHKTGKDWIIETPADIKKIEEENGINNPSLKINKLKAVVNNKKQSSDDNNSLLALSQSKNKKPEAIHNTVPVNTKKQNLSRTINNTDVEKNKTTKIKNQEQMITKEKNKTEINNIKPVDIPPQAEKENSIFAIPPKVTLTNAGWRISQIYHGNAIIVNSKGKSYAVKVGSFVDGHEVLSVKNNKIYMTGNILIK